MARESWRLVVVLCKNTSVEEEGERETSDQLFPNFSTLAPLWLSGRSLVSLSPNIHANIHLLLFGML